MKFVYILTSLVSGDHFYVGVTADLETRPRKHNAGDVSHTSKFRPWEIKTYIGFADDAQAHRFEAYLKSGSGRAFAKNDSDRNSHPSGASARQALWREGCRAVAGGAGGPHG